MEIIKEKEEKKLLQIFKKNKIKAQKLIKEPGKIIEILRSSVNHVNDHKGSFDEIWDNLQLCFGLVKDYLKGDYKQVPVGSIIAIIAALIYLVSPIDLIPDSIIGIGQIDDAKVLSYVIKQVISDLQKYQEWLTTQTVSA